MSTLATRPLDIRLMNMSTLVLLLVLVVLLALAGARALGRWSVFDLQRITVTGDIRHNSSATLRANVAPRISGTFFSIDLVRTRAAFESVPWVRSAVVRREFPNRLQVVLQEHQPVALWGAEGDLRLLDSYGEVFEANTGEVDQDNLPVLNGPDGQGPDVLAMYRALAPLFADMQLPLDQLTLSGGGSWTAHLADGASIALGRGSVDEVRARTRRLLSTLTQVVSRYGRQPGDLEYADLRHENGYAIRLHGVSTLAPQPDGK